MERIYFDINETDARRAKNMYSFSEYVSESETNAYISEVNRIYDMGDAAIARGVSAEKVERICNRFSKKYAEWINRSFRIELMCPSIMISGASNFPVRKKEKQNVARDKHWALYNDLMKVKSELEWMGTPREIIMAGDADAVERLQKKVTELEKKQSAMKAANVHWRKNGTMKGFIANGWEYADEKIKESLYGVPYPHYALTNNNNKLKNTRNRLESLKRVKERETTESSTDFCKVVENTEIMRLQLIFEGKPDEKIRSILKSNGFRWAPSQNAWQRQLTVNAKAALKRIEKEISENTL